MKKIKALLAIVLSAVMLMGMGVTIFAANADGSHDARLYKNDKYNSSNIDANLSMGDPAILDATVTESDGITTIVVGVDTNFKAYGMSGKLTKVTATDDGVTAVMAADGASFTIKMPTSQFSYGKVINIDFTVNVWIMPVASSGDLVIFA